MYYNLLITFCIFKIFLWYGYTFVSHHKNDAIKYKCNLELNTFSASNEVDRLASKYDSSPDLAVSDELAQLKAKLGVATVV